MFDRRWRSPVVWLLLGDWLALALFVFLGLVDHDLLSIYGWSRLLTSTVEVALPWTIIAALSGAYRLPPAVSKRYFLGRSLNAWLVAAPLALLVRAWIHGQATIIVIFFVVMLGLGGLSLLGWRVAFTLWLSRRTTSD